MPPAKHPDNVKVGDFAIPAVPKEIRAGIFFGLEELSANDYEKAAQALNGSVSLPLNLSITQDQKISLTKEQAKGLLAINGYVEETDAVKIANKQPEEGKYVFVSDQEIVIYLKPSPYPHLLVGETQDGQIFIQSIGGASGRIGITIKEALHYAQNLGLRNLMTVSQGTGSLIGYLPENTSHEPSDLEQNYKVLVGASEGRQAGSAVITVATAPTVRSEVRAGSLKISLLHSFPEDVQKDLLRFLTDSSFTEIQQMLKRMAPAEELYLAMVKTRAFVFEVKGETQQRLSTLLKQPANPGFLLQIPANWTTISDDEKRVTLAHEAGHIALYKAGRLTEDYDAFRKQLSANPNPGVENLVNGFADYEVNKYQIEEEWGKSVVEYSDFVLKIVPKAPNVINKAVDYAYHYLSGVLALKDRFPERENDLHKRLRAVFGYSEEEQSRINKILDQTLLPIGRNGEWQKSKAFAAAYNDLFDKLEELYGLRSEVRQAVIAPSFENKRILVDFNDLTQNFSDEQIKEVVFIAENKNKNVQVLLYNVDLSHPLGQFFRGLKLPDLKIESELGGTTTNKTLAHFNGEVVNLSSASYQIEVGALRRTLRGHGISLDRQYLLAYRDQKSGTLGIGLRDIQRGDLKQRVDAGKLKQQLPDYMDSVQSQIFVANPALAGLASWQTLYNSAVAFARAA